MRDRFLPLIVAASLVTAPVSAAADTSAEPATEEAPAAPPAGGAPAPASDAPSTADDEAALASAREKYQQGKAAFDTHQYEKAIEAWTTAYAELPQTDEARAIRNNLVYNIATAQEKAYEVDQDIAHLRQAKGLLERYVAEYKSLYKATPEGRKEVAEVETRIAEIDRKIAEAEGTASPTTPTAPGPANNAAYDQAAKRKAAVRDTLRNDPEIAPEYKTGRGMVIGGAVGLGVGGLFLLGAGAYASGNLTRTGRNATIGVAVVGAALAITGAVLLGLGIPKRKRAIRRAQEKVGVVPTPVPMLVLDEAPVVGAGVRARF